MRKVLITGGTGKIGSILVKQMINDGHAVVFTTTTSEKGQQLISELGDHKHNAFYIASTFTEEGAAANIVQQLPFEIDAIIQNARSLSSLKIEEDGSVGASQFNMELFMAVTFPYLLSHKVISSCSTLRDIIFIGSMYGTVAPSPGLYTDFEKQSPVNYGVAKAAQVHLTKELAVRYASRSVRVNCVSYGGVEGRVDEAFKKRYSQFTPLKRMLNETDLYPPVQFILNNPSMVMTGENIKIDGGWSIS
jgi:NAD(P)-dependent dehydrogenase (short-subunit alcohol dehydrogenase family)